MKKLTQEEFINSVIKLQGNKYSFEKTIYVNQRTPVIITCKKHQFDFNIIPSVLLGYRKKGNKKRSFRVGSCPKCHEEYFRKTKIIKKRVYYSTAKNTRAKATEHIERINGKRFYVCEVHGNVPVGECRDLCDGCPTCNIIAYKAKIKNNIKPIYIKLINKISTVNKSNKITYIPYLELKSRVNSLGITSHWEYRKWVKRTCQENIPTNPDRVYKMEWISYYDFFNKNKTDSMSAGENKIYNYLKRKKYNFETQKKFIDCKNIHSLPFDFYLPELNTLIEFDGQQHFKISNFSLSAEINIKKFEQLQKNDKIKTEYCKNKKINLIRLDDNELINNVMEWSLDIELSRIAAEIAISEFKKFS